MVVLTRITCPCPLQVTGLVRYTGRLNFSLLLLFSTLATSSINFTLIRRASWFCVDPASNPHHHQRHCRKITKLTEDIIHIHSGMTSPPPPPKPPEPSKLGDRIDRILLLFGSLNFIRLSGYLELFFCRFVPGFLSG
jgi:hypothetical protein